MIFPLIGIVKKLLWEYISVGIKNFASYIGCRSVCFFLRYFHDFLLIKKFIKIFVVCSYSPVWSGVGNLLSRRAVLSLLNSKCSVFPELVMLGVYFGDTF